MASIGSQGTVGGLIVAGLVSKTLETLCTKIDTILMKNDLLFELAAKNGWLACIGWYGCSLWLCLLLRAPVME